MKLHHLALALSLGLASCSGGSSDPKALNDDGYQKISAQDFEGAKSDFEAAVAALGDNTADSQYKDAKLGLIEALAHLNPDKAKDDFIALAGSLGDKITADDYSSVGGILVSANAAEAGLSIVHAGLEKFAGNAKLKKVLDAILAKAASDPALTSALGGLGYL
jgi:hypothetical protein